MTSNSRLAACVVVALAGASYTSAAGAQPQAPTAQDLDAARSLFREGKALRAQGDIRGALEKLRAAHALGNTPVTGIELARTYVVSGELVAARSLCLSIARIPIAPDETDKSAGARVEAARLADDLGKRIATLVVQVEGLASGEIAHVVIDGVAVPDAASSEAQKLDPGTHEVTAQVGDASGTRQARRSATLGEGETKQLTLVLPPPAVLSVPLPMPEQPLPPHGRVWPVVTTVGFATTLVGAAAGALAGVVALQKKGQLPSECNALKQCDGSNGGSGDLADAQSWALVSTVAWSVGAAGLVGGIVGAFLSARDDRPRPRGTSFAPWVGAGVAGVHGHF